MMQWHDAIILILHLRDTGTNEYITTNKIIPTSYYFTKIKTKVSITLEVVL